MKMTEEKIERLIPVAGVFSTGQQEEKSPFFKYIFATQTKFLFYFIYFTLRFNSFMQQITDTGTYSMS